MNDEVKEAVGHLSKTLDDVLELLATTEVAESKDFAGSLEDIKAAKRLNDGVLIAAGLLGAPEVSSAPLDLVSMAEAISSGSDECAGD